MNSLELADEYVQKAHHSLGSGNQAEALGWYLRAHQALYLAKHADNKCEKAKQLMMARVAAGYAIRESKETQ